MSDLWNGEVTSYERNQNAEENSLAVFGVIMKWTFVQLQYFSYVACGVAS